MNNKWYIVVILLISFLSCSSPEVRRPKTHTTSNFYEEIIEENIRLNNLEKKHIESFLAKDTTTNYLTSSNGFWYAYEQKDTLNAPIPVKGDVVTIRYNVSDFNDNLLYSEQTINYKVDKEDFIPGLQDGIKLMKKGETITFVIPSYRAFGVTGDGNKIRMNQTLKSRLTLIDIKKVNNEIN